jgi:hypothetical protein
MGGEEDQPKDEQAAEPVATEPPVEEPPAQVNSTVGQACVYPRYSQAHIETVSVTSIMELLSLLACSYVLWSRSIRYGCSFFWLMFTSQPTAVDRLMAYMSMHEPHYVMHGVHTTMGSLIMVVQLILYFKSPCRTVGRRMQELIVGYILQVMLCFCINHYMPGDPLLTISTTILAYCSIAKLIRVVDCYLVFIQVPVERAAEAEAKLSETITASDANLHVFYYSWRHALCIQTEMELYDIIPSYTGFTIMWLNFCGELTLLRTFSHSATHAITYFSGAYAWYMMCIMAVIAVFLDIPGQIRGRRSVMKITKILGIASVMLLSMSSTGMQLMTERAGNTHAQGTFHTERLANAVGTATCGWFVYTDGNFRAIHWPDADSRLLDHWRAMEIPMSSVHWIPYFISMTYDNDDFFEAKAPLLALFDHYSPDHDGAGVAIRSVCYFLNTDFAPYAKLNVFNGTAINSYTDPQFRDSKWKRLRPYKATE